MADDSRQSLYKNSGKDISECRRKREVENLSLRRNKREEQIEKRRQLISDAVNSPDSSQDENMLGGDCGLEVDPMPNIIARINSNSPEEQLGGIRSLRHILCKETDPPIRAVVQSGIVPKLVNILASVDSTVFQFETSWVLTNVAGGTSEDTETVVNAGALPVFTKLLHSPSCDVQDQAVWALGNIAGDSTRLRDAVISCNIVDHLLAIIYQFRHSKPALARNAVWCYSNLCRGRNPPPNYEKLLGAIPTLGGLLHEMSDPDVLADACWAIAYLADGPDANIQQVIDACCAPSVVAMLMHSNPRTVTAALRAVGSIVSGNDKQTQCIIDSDALPHLRALLNSQSQIIVKETCWALSNITAGSKTQIQAVLGAGLIPAVVLAMRNGESKTRRECTWLISNAIIGGTLEQAAYVAREGGLDGLCAMLSVPDLRVLDNVLIAIERCLRAGNKVKQLRSGKKVPLQLCNGPSSNMFAQTVEENGALEKIEVYTMHENEKIRKKASQIIERYFNSSVEDGGNMEIAGTMAGLQDVVASNGNTAPAFYAFTGTAATTGPFNL